MPRRARLLLLIAVAVTAGCGGDDAPRTLTSGSPDPTSTTVTTVATPTGTEAEPSGAVTLDGVRLITPDEARALILEQAVVIDVRNADEFAAGHVRGALNLSLENGDLESRLPTLEKDATYVLYCRSGNRSAQAAALMREAGFMHVGDAGGFDTLAAAGIPTA